MLISAASGSDFDFVEEFRVELLDDYLDSKVYDFGVDFYYLDYFFFFDEIFAA